MRIIGGRFRNKRLSSPRDQSVRPTSERAREALFNILDHAGLIESARFLDLFSGSGAVGLEAWSRGAEEVWLIDRDIALANTNVEAIGRPSAVHVRRLDATDLGRAPCRFDVAFLDPPYRSGLAGPALEGLDRGWLADDALVVLELAAKDQLDLPPGFEVEQDRHHGAARLLFLRSGRSAAEAEPS
ncbi:MAG: 16S rRNA (guanine(966)-N(2))-methyltransferase RsmD [Alphaproteobacteria bacterium]|nr:16S rRNA (guanine(966)-N(2))-methyltransferase RsmD [Alphaproteobacteria bacterium]